MEAQLMLHLHCCCCSHRLYWCNWLVYLASHKGPWSLPLLHITGLKYCTSTIEGNTKKKKKGMSGCRLRSTFCNVAQLHIVWNDDRAHHDQRFLENPQIVSGAVMTHIVGKPLLLCGSLWSWQTHLASGCGQLWPWRFSLVPTHPTVRQTEIWGALGGGVEPLPKWPRWLCACVLIPAELAVIGRCDAHTAIFTYKTLKTNWGRSTNSSK